MISRKTKQKQQLLKCIAKKKEFFTAEDVFADMYKSDSSIGLATIYRFLKAETAAHRLYSYTCDKRVVYSNSLQSHCHFECEHTGKIQHFSIQNLDFLKNKIPGKITSISIVVKGICESCEHKK
ncbi:MAG TPA: transcriptional repressor [Acidobacteriota bacterium]|nr:transcriptional repressor [Acidobacteriota bacterium]